MTREGISDLVLQTRDVNDFETISKCFLFEIPEPPVGHVKGPVRKDAKKWAMINSNSEIFAPQYKIFSLFQGIGDSQGFAFHWCVVGF